MAWSKEEIEEYKEIRRRELGPTYATIGIDIDNPEKRAEYLAERLNLTLTDHDVIMRTASKVEALIMLEDIDIKVFF